MFDPPIPVITMGLSLPHLPGAGFFWVRPAGRTYLRAIQLKHRKCCTTMYRELKALGAQEVVARRVDGNVRSYWRNAVRLLKTVLTNTYFD